MTNKLFAMDTHFACGPNLEPDRFVQIQAVRNAGYDGFHAMVDLIGAPEKLDGLLEGVSRSGLPLIGVYQQVDTRRAPDEGRLQALDRAIGRLPAGALIEFAISHGEFGEAAGDATKDESVLKWLHPLAEILERHGASGSLYPHFGFNVETLTDALRLSDRLGHPSIGVTFSGYHWFRVGREPDLQQLLREAAPRLRSANLNGSRFLPEGGDAGGLNPTIEPLDSGDLPVREILVLLKLIRFSGPIGVQGYGIDVPADEALTRSLAVLKGFPDFLPSTGVSPRHDSVSPE